MVAQDSFGSADVLDKNRDNARLITHRPLNAIFGASGGARSNDLANKMLQLALCSDTPAGVRMIVSGHVHSFQAVDYGGTSAATRGRHWRQYLNEMASISAVSGWKRSIISVLLAPS